MTPDGKGFLITGNKRFKIPNFGNQDPYLWNYRRKHKRSWDQINSIPDSGEI